MVKQNVVMNSAYGYLNEEDDVVGFDIQHAALFSNEDVHALLSETAINQEDITIITFTEDQLKNDLPFDLVEHPSYVDVKEPVIDYATAPIETEKFALISASYGYLNEEVEYKSFDLADAAIYTNDDMKRLGLKADDYIKQPFTDAQLEQVPFAKGLPNVQETPFGYAKDNHATETVLYDQSTVITPEHDFADFGKGLDDLDMSEPTQNQ